MSDDSEEIIDDVNPPIAPLPEGRGRWGKMGRPFDSQLATLAMPPDSELPEFLSKEHEKAWEYVKARHKLSLTLIGVRYVLGGYSFQDAAREVRLRSPDAIKHFCRQYNWNGLIGSTANLVRRHREITMAAQEALLKKLNDGGDQESARDLAVIMGIAHDKIAKYEERTGVSPGSTLLEQLVEAIRGADMRLTLTLEPNPDAETSGGLELPTREAMARALLEPPVIEAAAKPPELEGPPEEPEIAAPRDGGEWGF